MDIVASIWIKTKGGIAPDLEESIPCGWDISAERCYGGPREATHAVESEMLLSYYGPGYERGPWLEFAELLMALHATEGIEAVWYYGHSDDEPDDEPPFTMERVLEFCAHFMKNGYRPYRKSAGFD